MGKGVDRSCGTVEKIHKYAGGRCACSAARRRVMQSGALPPPRVHGLRKGVSASSRGEQWEQTKGRRTEKGEFPQLQKAKQKFLSVRATPQKKRNTALQERGSATARKRIPARRPKEIRRNESRETPRGPEGWLCLEAGTADSPSIRFRKAGACCRGFCGRCRALWRPAIYCLRPRRAHGGCAALRPRDRGAAYRRIPRP